nr:cyclic nucleotide-binding protein [Synechococcus elongatus PCC 11801]
MPMFAPASTVKALQRDAEDLLIPAGSVIFAEGEAAEEMYGILSGEVELKVGDRTVEVLKTGDVFGEGALVQAQKFRATTAIARQDCRLARLDRRRFLFAIQETPTFALDVIRSFSRRLRTLKQTKLAGAEA